MLPAKASGHPAMTSEAIREAAAVTCISSFVRDVVQRDYPPPPGVACRLVPYGDAGSPETSTFLFRKSETGWFLKAPEIACGNDPGMEVVSEALRDQACAGVSSS